MTLSDIKRMQLGQVVDYCIEHANMHFEAEKEAEQEEKRKGKRKANQADWDAFLG